MVILYPLSTPTVESTRVIKIVSFGLLIKRNVIHYNKNFPLFPSNYQAAAPAENGQLS